MSDTTARPTISLRKRRLMEDVAMRLHQTAATKTNDPRLIENAIDALYFAALGTNECRDFLAMLCSSIYAPTREWAHSVLFVD